jgi:hypothetical protein
MQLRRLGAFDDAAGAFDDGDVADIVELKQERHDFLIHFDETRRARVTF